MKKITCQNCKHTETIKELDSRKNLKMFMTKTYFDFEEGLESRRGLVVYVVICFSCKHFTLFAKKLFGVEYFETFKYNSSRELDCGLHARPYQIFSLVYNMVHDINFSGSFGHMIKELEKMKRQ